MEAKLIQPVYVIAGNTVGKSHIRHDNAKIFFIDENSDKFWCAQSVISQTQGEGNKVSFKVWDGDVFTPFYPPRKAEEHLTAIKRASSQNVVLCSQGLPCETLIELLESEDTLQLVIIARPESDLLIKAEQRGDLNTFSRETIKTWSSFERLLDDYDSLLKSPLADRVLMCKIEVDEHLTDVLPNILTDNHLVKFN